MNLHHRRRAGALWLTSFLTLLVLVAGCGTDGDESSGSAGGSSSVETAEPAEPRGEQRAADAEAVPADEAGTAPGAPEIPTRVVSTGTVSLRADDVGALRSEVQRIADAQGGEVAEQTTDTGRDGEVVRSRMVLRVPGDSFAETMDLLERAGTLRTSDQDSQVVSAEYVDLEARVRAQQKSVARVELLFQRAEKISDVLAVETELARRQADLDALEGRLRLLDDQVRMSTITVHLDRTPRGTEPEEDDTWAFLAGLRGGWAALTALLSGAAAAVGAALPFAVLVALVGLPGWWVARRLRRRGPARADAAAAEPAAAGPGNE
jgi:hypothetical protein